MAWLIGKQNSPSGNPKLELELEKLVAGSEENRERRQGGTDYSQ
jgi:hypothetical protein